MKGYFFKHSHVNPSLYAFKNIQIGNKFKYKPTKKVVAKLKIQYHFFFLNYLLGFQWFRMFVA